MDHRVPREAVLERSHYLPLPGEHTYPYPVGAVRAGDPKAFVRMLPATDMERRAFLATGAATLGTALAGCVGSDRRDFDIGMVSDAFVPGSTVEVPESAPAWVPRDIPTVEVRVGDPLVWGNTGSRIHTVTAATRHHPEAEAMIRKAGGHGHGKAVPRLPDSASFFSSGDFDGELAAVESFFQHLNGGGAIPPDDRYAHTFHTPGWYHYYCIPHEPAGMMGNVRVLPP
ncbi:MAG: plastocyanin/azurin family copper-binding protein [Halorhabdus sp.]